jgi:hypothetical protein
MPFSEDYFRLFENVPAFHDRVTQKYLLASSGAQISERLMRCIWYDRLYDQQKLVTKDGRNIIVHSPGTWNLESGPDFVRADLSIGTARLKGDVELHLEAAGWRLHKHSLDKRYDNVILHVILKPGARQETPVTSHGVEIPEAGLWECLTDNLKVLSCALRPEEYPYKSLRNFGRCHGLLEQTPLDSTLRLLHIAGDARIIAKQRRFSYEAEKQNLDQIAYAALLEGMGYKSYRKQFSQLAQRLPYEQLRESVASSGACGASEQALLTQALLMGTAGMLGDSLGAGSSEAREYSRRLRELWRTSGLKNSERGNIEWKGSAVRPANLPQRRIAGVSHVLAQTYGDGVFKWILACTSENDAPKARLNCIESMSRAEDSFWSYHYSVSGERLGEPVGLLGADRALTILVNSFVPLALLNARNEDQPGKEDRVHGLYCSLPSPQPNAITRLMEYRMFGDSSKLRKARSARIQQGLMQVYADWCSEDPSCENCGVFTCLQSGRIGER